MHTSSIRQRIIMFLLLSAIPVIASFVATDEDISCLRRVPCRPISFARPLYVDPVPAFLDSRGIGEDEFSRGILNFAKGKFRDNDTSRASQSLMFLRNLSDTNTVPWIRNFVSDPSNANRLSSVLYLYAIRGDKDDFNLIMGLMQTTTISVSARKDLYRGCNFRVANDVKEPNDYRQYGSCCWYPFLRKMLEQEEDFSLRIAIDDIFASQLKGWRYSEERKDIFSSWLHGDLNSRDREFTQFLIMQIDEGIRNGNADDRVLCEIKPRVLTPEEIEKQLSELSNSVQKVDSPSTSIQGGSPSMCEIKERRNCRFTRPLAVSAIATALLGIAGFLWRRRKR